MRYVVRQDIELYLETNPTRIKESKETKEDKPKTNIMIKTNKIINNEPDKTNPNEEIDNNTENETIPKQEMNIIELEKTELKTSPLKNVKQS